MSHNHKKKAPLKPNQQAHRNAKRERRAAAAAMLAAMKENKKTHYDTITVPVVEVTVAGASKPIVYRTDTYVPKIVAGQETRVPAGSLKQGDATTADPSSIAFESKEFSDALEQMPAYCQARAVVYADDPFAIGSKIPRFAACLRELMIAKGVGFGFLVSGIHDALSTAGLVHEDNQEKSIFKGVQRAESTIRRWIDGRICAPRRIHREGIFTVLQSFYGTLFNTYGGMYHDYDFEGSNGFSRLLAELNRYNLAIAVMRRSRELLKAHVLGKLKEAGIALPDFSGEKDICDSNCMAGDHDDVHLLTPEIDAVIAQQAKEVFDITNTRAVVAKVTQVRRTTRTVRVRVQGGQRIEEQEMMSSTPPESGFKKMNPDNAHNMFGLAQTALMNLFVWDFSEYLKKNSQMLSPNNVKNVNTVAVVIMEEVLAKMQYKPYEKTPAQQALLERLNNLRKQIDTENRRYIENIKARFTDRLKYIQFDANDYDPALNEELLNQIKNYAKDFAARVATDEVDSQYGLVPGTVKRILNLRHDLTELEFIYWIDLKSQVEDLMIGFAMQQHNINTVSLMFETNGITLEELKQAIPRKHGKRRNIDFGQINPEYSLMTALEPIGKQLTNLHTTVDTCLRRAVEGKELEGLSNPAGFVILGSQAAELMLDEACNLIGCTDARRLTEFFGNEIMFSIADSPPPMLSEEQALECMQGTGIDPDSFFRPPLVPLTFFRADYMKANLIASEMEAQRKAEAKKIDAEAEARLKQILNLPGVVVLNTPDVANAMTHGPDAVQNLVRDATIQNGAPPITPNPVEYKKRP